MNDKEEILYDREVAHKFSGFYEAIEEFRKIEAKEKITPKLSDLLIRTLLNKAFKRKCNHPIDVIPALVPALSGIGRESFLKQGKIVDPQQGEDRLYQNDRLKIAQFRLEIFREPENAIKREKRIKKYPRKWKLNLIEKDNPGWKDLYEDVVSGLPERVGQ